MSATKNINIEKISGLGKTNLSATTSPTSTDDINAGYSVGSFWIDTATDKVYFCVDATVGSAVWVDVSSSASLYTQDDTIGSGRVATLTDTLTFDGGTVNIQGADTVGTNSALEIFDGDTVPSSLWDFRNNGNVEIGQFTTLKSSKNVTGSDTIFEINASNNRSSILVVSDTSGYNGIQIASYGSTASGASANKLGIAGGLDVGELVLMNKGNGVKDAEVWFSIGEGSSSDWADTNTTAKFDVNTFYVNNGKSLIVGSGVTPTAIGTENISLQGDTLIDGTLDMNNNRITKTIVNPTVQETTSAATFTINATNENTGVLTAQAVALTVANPTGTIVQGQKLVYRIKDNGTARAITWGANFRAIGVTLPTTTTANKLLYVGCIYNTTDSKWDVIAVNEEA